jgi:peptidoglycan/LPS O-acetylase OafA/YrhL
VTEVADRIQAAPAAPVQVGLGPARLAGLDGLRAFSVAAVIVYHVAKQWGFTQGSKFWQGLFLRFAFGVTVFFVLSGFLITWLLLKEERKAGRVRIGAFYARRSLRILPPAYFCLAGVALLTAAGAAAVPAWDMGVSALFLRNYYGVADETAHFWSLAVEEQFYLLWPLLFVLTRRFRLAATLTLLAAGLAWECVLKTWTGGAVQPWRFDLCFAPLLVGCALALLRDGRAGPRLRGMASWGWWVPAAGMALIVFGLSSLRNWSGVCAGVFLSYVSYVGVAVVINHVVEGPKGLLGRVLNAGPVAWLGRMSFSLYLWQQIFCWNTTGAAWTRWPWNVCLAMTMACVSYYAVERPALYVRDRLMAAH